MFEGVVLGYKGTCKFKEEEIDQVKQIQGYNPSEGVSISLTKRSRCVYGYRSSNHAAGFEEIKSLREVTELLNSTLQSAGQYTFITDEGEVYSFNSSLGSLLTEYETSTLSNYNANLKSFHLEFINYIKVVTAGNQKLLISRVRGNKGMLSTFKINRKQGTEEMSMVETAKFINDLGRKGLKKLVFSALDGNDYPLE